MQIKGIGPWTADIYLVAALGRPDIWPDGDLEFVFDSIGGRGTFVITVTGSFPAATGILMVSIASNQDTDPNEFIAGTIDSWTTTEIVFTVLTVREDLSPWNEDFSFMLLGQ